jgi:hypothetical protein
MPASFTVIVLDVSRLSYADRVTAACLQGLVNRNRPALFLDHGIYDDPAARKTNEDFMPDDLWYGKFREYLGNQDRHNLEAYHLVYSIQEQTAINLDEVVKSSLSAVHGVVVWDPSLEDSINIALMLSALEGLLPIPPEKIEWAEQLDLRVVHDLRGRWSDRVALYTWAFENLYPRCAPDKLACIEPGWQRPEFLDYAVKEKIFTYSLASKGSDGVFECGWKLMLLLLGGTGWLRNLIYNLGLYRRLKHLALGWMATDPEVGLAAKIQQKIAALPGCIIFGWHTRRDDEFAFMQLLSANGLRLVPSHMASNFSFHSALPAVVPLKQSHVGEEEVKLEDDKTYLTFTYSDGDQLMLMNTAQIGGWRRPERGEVPFNWEMQPLLAELAPALLGLFYSTLTPNDCLVAGPSGAGYVIPPLHEHLPAYLSESARICRLADINVITSYYPDPPEKVIRMHLQAPDNILGYLSGYFYMTSKPVRTGNGKIFLCNAWPHLSQVSASSEEVLVGVKKLIESPGEPPRFIAVHLFAYRTTITDVYHFVQSLDPNRVKVVRADEFLMAAKKFYS